MKLLKTIMESLRYGPGASRSKRIEACQPSVAAGNRRDFMKGTAVFIAAGGAVVTPLGPPPLTDPDWLKLTINTDNRTIRVNNHNVTAQAVYSKLKMLWKYSDEDNWFVRYPFPMIAITPVLFEMIEGWRIENPEVLNFDTFKMERGILANELKETG